MVDEWPTKTLKSVCTKIGSGATPRGGKDSYKVDGISLVRSQNVFNTGFSRNGLAFIDDKQAGELSNVVLEKNDVLINITGESVCRCCQVPDSVLPARVNQHVMIVRPTPGILDPTFLRYYIVSRPVQAHLEGLSSAGATRRALTKSMIETLEVTLPPIEIQRAIASILGALDDKIELNRRMNATLESLARAIFKSWFVDFDPVRWKREGRRAKSDKSAPDPAPFTMPAEILDLFPATFQDSELGKIPAGWEAKRWGDIATLEYGKNLRGYRDAQGPYRVWGTNGPIGWHIQTLCASEGVIIGRKGAYRGVHYSPDPFFVIDTAFYLQPKVEFDLLWAYYELLEFDINSLDSGSAIPSTSRDDFYAIGVCVPSTKVLREFRRIISPWYTKIEANWGNSNTLSSLRDTLLPKLLSGELPVPDALKAAEEALA